MRLTAMRTMPVVICTTVLALGLAGCGTGSESQFPVTTSAPDAALFGDCKADDPALGGATVIAEADVDGSGAMNEIAYVPEDAGGPCADALFTTFNGKPSAMSLADAPLDPDSAEVIQLRGTDRQLLVVRGQAHPRGGYMVHLYGAADRRLGEVLADGEPVIGFVATDGGMLPATAQCTDDGGIATFTATTHEPPGIVLAWDVTRTTYSLDGNTAKQTSLKQIRTAAADPSLRKEMPQLFEPEGYFADCIVQRR